MGHWTGVLRAFDELVKDQERAREQREQAERRSAAFDAWCEQAEERILEEVKAALGKRAGELGERFGVSIDVEYPSEMVLFLRGGGRMRFLRVAYGSVEVHVYSTRGPGELPMIHYAHAVRAARARFPRLVSVPGFLLRRGVDGQPELRPCGKPSAEELSVDDVACKVLAMLAAATHAQTPALAPS